MKPSKPTIKPYTRRSESYKAEALKLADRIGYMEAARQCGQTKAGRIWRLSLTYFPAEADYTQYLGLSQPVGL